MGMRSWLVLGGLLLLAMSAGCRTDFGDLFPESVSSSTTTATASGGATGAGGTGGDGPCQEGDLPNLQAGDPPLCNDCDGCPKCVGNNKCTFGCNACGCECPAYIAPLQEDELEALCSEATTCDVACEVDQSCNLVCRDCDLATFACGDAVDACSSECSGAESDCTLTCASAGSCTMTCSGGARCLLTCTDATSCDLACDGRATDCGNDVHACNRDCPG